MEQRKLVEQLQSRCSPDHFRMASPVNVPSGRDVSPMAHGRPYPLASLPQKIIQPGRQIASQYVGWLPVIQLTPELGQLADLFIEQTLDAGQGHGDVGGMGS